jgi:hypothetical protein
MYATPIHALPAPDQLPPDIGPDVPKDLKGLADALDPKLTPYSQGNGDPVTLGIASGKPGQRFHDNITGNIYLDIGPAWVLETPQINPAANVAGLRTLGTGALEAAAGNDPRLSDQRVPTNGSVDASKVAAALKPSGGAAAATEALRALGVTSGTAAAGNDSRLSDARTPTGAAGGDLTGNFPNPNLKPRNGVWIVSAEGLQRLYFGAGGTTYIKGAGLAFVSSADVNILELDDVAHSGTLLGPLKAGGGVQWPPPLVTTGSLAAGQGGIPNPIPDGFVVLLQVDSANGINWPLRYRAGSGSAYKWESWGDPTSLWSELIAGEAFSAGAANNWNDSSVLLTAPLAGEYDVSWGAYVNANNDPATTYLYVVPNVLQDSSGLVTTGVATNGDGLTWQIQRTRKVTLTAGQVVRLQSRWSNGSGVHSYKTLALRPRRVG